jgi:hypothetical protein
MFYSLASFAPFAAVVSGFNPTIGSV